jgi:hypothetical protein
MRLLAFISLVLVIQDDVLCFVAPTRSVGLDQHAIFDRISKRDSTGSDPSKAFPNNMDWKVEIVNVAPELEHGARIANLANGGKIEVHRNGAVYHFAPGTYEYMGKPATVVSYYHPQMKPVPEGLADKLKAVGIDLSRLDEQFGVPNEAEITGDGV